MSTLSNAILNESVFLLVKVFAAALSFAEGLLLQAPIINAAHKNIMVDLTMYHQYIFLQI
jgi:hypothetical protein